MAHSGLTYAKIARAHQAHPRVGSEGKGGGLSALGGVYHICNGVEWLTQMSLSFPTKSKLLISQNTVILIHHKETILTSSEGGGGGRGVATGVYGYIYPPPKNQSK